MKESLSKRFSLINLIKFGKADRIDATELTENFNLKFSNDNQISMEAKDFLIQFAH